ncbi:MAG: S9 family peptidase [Proteobacteria bacterium]|nr:S9 family peptidase [Pseudomonadota bacterium]
MSSIPSRPQPPLAHKKPHELTTHGHTRVDEYYWLRDDERKDPEVLAYLKAENDYLKKVLGSTDGLQQALFQELKGRIKQDDRDVPTRRRNYWYYSRYEQGKEYPIYCRRHGSMEAPEQVILDANELARGKTYYAAAGLTVSENEQILAYADDTGSRRLYTLRFKDLRTGEHYLDAIPNVSTSLAWAADDRTIFYVKKELGTLRTHQVWRHTLGTPLDQDVLVHDEPDEAFYLRVRRSRSRELVVIDLDSTLVTESRVLSANDPHGTFRAVLAREPNHEYQIDHIDDVFYIRTNWKAKNFRLMKVKVERSSDKKAWREVIPHRNDVLLTDVLPFADYLVVGERLNALRQLRVVPRGTTNKDHPGYYIEFPEQVYVAASHDNPSTDVRSLRFAYSSPVTPDSVFEMDMETRERKLLKQDEVLGGFDPSNYATERLFVSARDGTQVPVSLVYPEGFKRDGSSPLFVYGYGSYGSSSDPYFRSGWLSLLDRGIAIAIAHVRGGQELGRGWYEDGKMFRKLNTFTDFIDVTERLVELKYAHGSKVVAEGQSAGGLLIGAVANMRPELYLAMHAGVPFVDVVTTMLDESIPLTTNEFDEWGDPANKDSYDYMLSYSPYDNVKRQDYPHLIVTTGVHDSQVQYWEPAKWVARLRTHKTDDHLLVLDVDLESGHGGASGRFKRLRRRALVYAFFLHLLGLDQPQGS